MENNEIVFLVFIALMTVAWGQVDATGNIGNRAYSVWYSTHFLLEKKGILKWIWFSPKHFGRYTLYEVIVFFLSLLCPFVFGGLAVLRACGVLGELALFIIGLALLFMLPASMAVIALVNDIGSRRDEKKKFYLLILALKLIDFLFTGRPTLY